MLYVPGDELKSADLNRIGSSIQVADLTIPSEENNLQIDLQNIFNSRLLKTGAQPMTDSLRVDGGRMTFPNGSMIDATYNGGNDINITSSSAITINGNPVSTGSTGGIRGGFISFGDYQSSDYNNMIPLGSITNFGSGASGQFSIGPEANQIRTNTLPIQYVFVTVSAMFRPAWPADYFRASLTSSATISGDSMDYTVANATGSVRIPINASAIFQISSNNPIRIALACNGFVKADITLMTIGD